MHIIVYSICYYIVLLFHFMYSSLDSIVYSYFMLFTYYIFPLCCNTSLLLCQIWISPYLVLFYYIITLKYNTEQKVVEHGGP